MNTKNQNDDWNSGDLVHLIPIANDKSFLIKASFSNLRQNPPVLTVDKQAVPGIKTDVKGRFWQFFVTDLSPGQTYSLRPQEDDGSAICDPWKLKTFPARDSKSESLKILAFTCAGGMDGPKYEGKTLFLNMDARRQLLAKGMSLDPDLVISNGDHIYWDMKTSMNKPDPFFEFLNDNYWNAMGGELDLDVPMLHPKNEEIFLNICNHQIAGLYGTTLRSTPSFFLTDDHDLFENDEFDDELATLPPDSYGINAGETTQFLYYPEFLPDENMPYWLEGSGRAGRISGTNMLNGTLRYGDLLEANLYDCRRNVNYKEKHAKVVTESVEQWLVSRAAAEEDTRHYFQAPSLALCYTSGKLGDWYPDVLNDDGELVLDEPKEQSLNNFRISFSAIDRYGDIVPLG